MENVKAIVVAIDLEAGSNAVLTQAIRLATAHAAGLLVLHVIEAEPLAQVAALSNRSEGDLRDELKRYALSTIEALVFDSQYARRTNVQIEFGAPHQVITRIASERYADLLVIGPGKSRSLSERVLGSTADRVIRAAAAPVLVVRKESAEPYRQVVAAVDFSAQSAAAVKDARRLLPEASIHLVHAVEMPFAFVQAMLRAGTSQMEIEQYRSARADKARQELSAFVDQVGGARVAGRRVVEGEPGSVLVQLSEDAQVDLLAIGPHGRGVVQQALLGSVTKRVLAGAACDILVAGT